MQMIDHNEFMNTGYAVGDGGVMYVDASQVQGYGMQSDVWAAGIVFYELLSGAVPFNAKDIAELQGQILEFDVQEDFAADAGAS